MSNWQQREQKLQKKSRVKNIQKSFERKDTTTEVSKRLRRQTIQEKVREREGGSDDLDSEV